MEAVESAIPQMGPMALSNTFWAICRLGEWENLEWKSLLIDAMLKSISDFPSSQIASALYTIADIEKSHGGSNRLDQLKKSLVGITAEHIEEFKGVHDLISIATSFARLRICEQIVLSKLTEKISNQFNQISMNDISTVLWALTRSQTRCGDVIQKLVHSLESRVYECSLKNLTDIVWSLSKLGAMTKEETCELYRFTLAPVIRGKIIDASVREISTIMWSYATAEVFDSDFFRDLSIALIPKIHEMNAHDISSVIWALGSVNFAYSDLVSGLKHVAFKNLNQFSPLQLSRVIYGLVSIGVRDSKIFSQFVHSAHQRMHLLYTQNIVEILLGLNHAGLVGEFGGEFLKSIESQTQRISGRDAVQLLVILGDNRSKISLVDNHELIQSLIEILSDRFNVSGRWIPSGFDLVDAIHACGCIGIADCELLEKILIHLSTVYKSPSFGNDLFLRFLDAVSTLSSMGDPVVKTLVRKLFLLRTNGIQSAMETLVERFGEQVENLTPTGAIEILDWFSNIGYFDVHVEKIFLTFSRSSFDVLRGAIGIEGLLHVCSASAELGGIESDWVNDVLDNVQVIDVNDDRGVLEYLWSRLALGEDPVYITPEWWERLNQIDVENLETHRLMEKAKQIALSASRAGVATTWSESVLKIKPWWIVGEKNPSRRRMKPKSLIRHIDKYSSFISMSLSELGIAHKVNAVVVPNVYTVTASLTGENSVHIDLVGPSDVIAPHGTKWTGTRILKGIHLAGKPVVTLRMLDVQRAIEENSLNPFLADKLAPFVGKAKKRVSFISSPQPAEKSASSNIIDDILLGRR